jgi:hypothetical protein
MSSQPRPLAASQPGFATLDPLPASLLGVVLFGEHIRAGAAGLAGEALSLAVVAAAAVLSHRCRIAGEDSRRSCLVTPAVSNAANAPSATGGRRPARAEGAGRVLSGAPARHPRRDGPGNLAPASAGQHVPRTGDVVTTTLTRGQHPGEPRGRARGGLPGCRDARRAGYGPPGYPRQRDLEPAGASRTQATHTCGWTQLTDEKRLPPARATRGHAERP